MGIPVFDHILGYISFNIKTKQKNSPCSKLTVSCGLKIVFTIMSDSGKFCSSINCV